MGTIPIRDDAQDFHDAADRLGNAAVIGEDPNDPEYLNHLQTIRAGTELAKLQYEKEHPWGSPENHPGTLGKIGHVMGIIGQAAGTAFAPRVMAAIPGTYLNRGLQARDYEAELQRGTQDELAQHRETAAETLGKENADTRLAQAEAAQTKAAADLDKASAAPKQPQEKGVWVNDASGKPVYLPESKVMGAAPGTYSPFEKPATTRATDEDGFIHDYLGANGLPDTPVSRMKAREAYAARNKQAERLSPIEGAMLVRSLLQHGYGDNPALLQSAADVAKYAGLGLSPSDIAAISQTPQGWQYDPVTGKPLGKSSPEFARGQTVQRLQFSKEIMPTVDETIQMAESDPNLFGAIKGRVNEIMSGKIGEPNAPYYAALTNLHNIATAWMRMHANSDEARKVFEDLLKTAQSPENLIAALNAIKRQMGIYATYGGKPESQQGPKAGAVEGGYRFKGGDPADQRNWEKVQ
jgi:hypothetical protein